MPVSLRKYYKRSRKLILIRYKMKDENKQACDLMLHYREDLRLAHRMKEWFYDICQMEAYRQQQRESDDWIANAQSYGIRNFKRFRTRILHCTSQDKKAGNAEADLACPKSVKPGTKHKKGPFHRIGAGF